MRIKSNQISLSGFSIETNDDPTLETISLTLYVAGCIRQCKECQNPLLQKINFSKLTPVEEVKKIIDDKSCLITSVSFCGGDFLPIYQTQLLLLCDYCHIQNLRTILYTGELYEDITLEVKKKIDILIDGPYDCTNKNSFVFPASINQRCWIYGKQIDPTKLPINRK